MHSCIVALLQINTYPGSPLTCFCHEERAGVGAAAALGEALIFGLGAILDPNEEALEDGAAPGAFDDGGALRVGEFETN
jgi:hypothetical protein